jgi:hypothetical protein
MRWRSEVIGLAGLIGCRFGGPTADPGEYVAFPNAAADRVSPAPWDDATTISPGDDGNDGAGGDANTDDASTTVSSSDEGNGGAGNDANTEDAPGSGTTEGGACSVAVAVCDPVHNTGCSSLQQCDVDTSQTTVPTGLCVFASPAEGGPCLATFVTESCPPRFTCVAGDCRQLCFCNADCPTGECCSDTSGPPGFALCRPCP